MREVFAETKDRHKSLMEAMDIIVQKNFEFKGYVATTRSFIFNPQGTDTDNESDSQTNESLFIILSSKMRFECWRLNTRECP